VNCPFCHFPNEPNAPFCVNCGAAMPAARPPRTQAQPQQQPQMPVVTPAAPPPPPAYPQAPGQPPPAYAPATGYGQPQPYPGAAQQPPVAAAPPVVAAPAAVDAQAAGAAPAAQQWAEDPAKTQPPTAKKGGGKGLIIAVIVIGVVVLFLIAGAAVGYFVFMKGQDAVKGETKVTSTGEETGKGSETGKAGETGKEGTPQEKGTGKEAGTGKTGGNGTSAGTEKTKEKTKEANPILKKTALSSLYQSQIFRQNDKVKYAGASFSIRTSIKILSKSALPAKAKLKKGKLAADVEIILYDKAKLKKFKVSLIDGSGDVLSPDSDVEKVLELPEREGERHLLWKKLAKSKKKSTTYLHRVFVVDEDKASNLIVEISNTNLDRPLWIEVDSEQPK
jgi:hypothetical protein